MDGEVMRLGGKHLDADGYDLLGLMTGSEGLLGVVTEVTVRILQQARDRARAAARLPVQRRRPGDCVADDHRRRHHPRRHGDDGPPGDPRRRGFRPRRLSARRRGAADRRAGRPGGGGRPPDRRRSRRSRARSGAVLASGSSQTRRSGWRFWAGRKAAFPAVGRISPDYYCMDGTIPRRQLPHVLTGMRRDVGRLRPARRQRLPRRRRQPASADPLRRQQARASWSGPRRSAPTSCRLCVEVGGVLTGEHGVGVEKRDLMGEMFTENDLDQQQRRQMRLRSAASAQPGQGVPDAAPLRRAGPGARPSAGKLAFPELPRF